MSNGNKGPTVVVPTRTSCKKVLYFEIVVGWTEAEGIEKSQYRLKVFFFFKHPPCVFVRRASPPF